MLSINKVFLHELSKEIDDHIFDHLSLSGFDNTLNKLNINDLKELIQKYSLPAQEDRIEYCWAIHESGIENICNINNAYLKSYIISIALYSHRNLECIDSLDESFYYLFITSCSSFSTSTKQHALDFLFFLKDDVDYPEEYPPNNDFFLLLSISYLSSLLGKKINNLGLVFKEWDYPQLDSIYSDFAERWSNILNNVLSKDINYFLLDIFTRVTISQINIDPISLPSSCLHKN